MTPSTPTITHARTRAWSWLPVLAVLCVTGVFAIPATPRAPAAIEAAGAPLIESPAVIAADPDDIRRRCAWCGRVQNIRRIEATATEPLSFEFTVRLYGGEIHTSTFPTAGPWLAGDRIILVGAER
jgi:hypothetical protein